MFLQVLSKFYLFMSYMYIDLESNLHELLLHVLQVRDIECIFLLFSLSHLTGEPFNSVQQVKEGIKKVSMF